jgi:hypothetical protein
LRQRRGVFERLSERFAVDFGDLIRADDNSPGP